MHVARQRVFVTPCRPARPNGLDLQIYISGWVIFKIKLKNRLKKIPLRDGDSGRALARALAVAASDLQLQVLYLILALSLSSILEYKSVLPVI